MVIGETKEGCVPRIGNNCRIGAGSVLIGDINIGDGAIIGAHSLVCKDVRAGATVVGEYAKELMNSGIQES